MPLTSTMTDLSPRDEGSTVACACLIVLHRHPSGLRVSDVARLTGYAEHVVRMALRGLGQRERVRCLVPGDDGVYVLAQHARARAATI